MKILYAYCLLSLILKLCNGKVHLCLLTSVNSYNTWDSDVCNQEGSTTLLENDENHIYHVIEKRDVISQNTTQILNNSTDTPEKVATWPSIIDINSDQQNSTLYTQTSSTTEESSTKYNKNLDPDSADDAVEVNELHATISRVDHHRYYKSFLKHGNKDVKPYWVDFKGLEKNGVIINKMLSDSYRRALTVPLSFRFPFYGHVLDNVTIATGGFLFTGAFLHKWLAATQYIAPLMANFDTSVSEKAVVKYVDNSTSLTVQWENVLLQDNKDVGPFTFQVTINSFGHIIFAYKDIPITVSLIEDNKHPVKVGLSDAYIVEKTIFYLRKKTIYEYHKIDMKKGFSISNQTAIVFEPMPNCIQFVTCETCLTKISNFKCEWCQKVGRCSDGFDRHRQDWIEGECMKTSQINSAGCADLPPFIPTTKSPVSQNSRIISVVKDKSPKGHLGGVMIALIILASVAGMVAWVSYAYYHPHTTSGQMLIKYRPSTWSCRGSRARYTAATMNSVHM